MTANPRAALRIVSRAFSAVLFVLMAALIVGTIVVPKTGGATPLTILTSSMEPGLPPGTLIVVRPVDPATLQVGDIVTYQIESGRPAVITHRLTDVGVDASGQRQLILQGDNNSEPDQPIIAEQVMGKLWYAIPYVGYAANILSGQAKSWIAPALGGLLLLNAAWLIGRGLVEAFRRHRAVAVEAGTADAASTEPQRR